MTLSTDILRADLERAFGVGGGGAAPGPGPRLGLEVEALPVDLATGRPVPIPRTLDALAPLGWTPRPCAKSGAVELHRPDGARLSFEPGGQVEYSTAPHETGTALLADVDDALDRLAGALASAGIALRMAGLDPVTPVDDVPLQLDAPRYRRMDAHFAAIGPSGRRMMRQTAAMQLSLDLGPAPLDRWRLLARLAPIAAAAFANSPLEAGRPTGERSARRRIWAELDPRRTGLVALGPDPAGEYLDFALAAPAFLLGDDPARAEPFARWLARGATLDDWHAHLSTLFPDVRPRGYFEFRVADAAPGDAAAALVALVAGTARRADAAEAAERLPEPTPALMARAGRDGLADAVLAGGAAAAVELALDGCAAAGDTLLAPPALARARRFFEAYTLAGRSPADAALGSGAVYYQRRDPGGSLGVL